ARGGTKNSIVLAQRKKTRRGDGALRSIGGHVLVAVARSATSACQSPRALQDVPNFFGALTQGRVPVGFDDFSLPGRRTMATSPPICTSTFRQVDVFTSMPFRGNPLAVLLDADDLDAAAMQRIAAWTNLSETAFVLKPTQAEASYRVRIFTPRSELPFAGHPSVGTAHALLEAGLIKPGAALVQECGAGLLPLSVDD